MASATQNSVASHQLNWGVVNPYIEQSSMMVLTKILQSLISHGPETSVETLAENHINPKLTEELTALDHKVKAVYDQLLKKTLEKIHEVSLDYIGVLFQAIKIVTGDETAGEKFVQSFVLIEARELFTKLNEMGFFKGGSHV